MCEESETHTNSKTIVDQRVGKESNYKQTDGEENDDGTDDDLTDHGRPPNPLEEASFLSRAFFIWPYKLLQMGMKGPLQEENLPEISKTETSEYNGNMLERIWREEKRLHPRNPHTLHWAILKDYFRTTWFLQPFLALSSTAKVVQAVAVGLLIETFQQEPSKSSSSRGYLWAGVIVIASAIVLFQHHHTYLITWRKGMQLRIASVSAIYSKTLSLSSTSKDNYASNGKTMNLASNDVERFLLSALFINNFIWPPLQSIAILIVGLHLLGPAFAAGFALLVFGFVPLQFYLSRRFGKLRSQIAHLTDRRVTLVSQAIYGVRVMKMSGWEWQLLERIANERALEIAQITKANRLKALNEALFYSSNIVISIVIFMVHVVGLGQELTPRNVFTVMTLINIVQVEIAKHVSIAVMAVSECYVSISRLQQFFDYPEIPDSVANSASSSGPAIVMNKVVCYWNLVKCSDNQKMREDDSYLMCALSDISLELERGCLTSIVGSVGSGKSALLQAIVGELSVASGTIERNYKSLAYAAQDPWIMDGTVRENITMGHEWDEEHYQNVVNACGLTVDFGQFTRGDRTLVGDRGVQCSGGQRARIGLARALYKNADILVLDDPLSAVDAKVGRLIFNEAIMGLGVNRGKCVVLATHQHQFLSDVRCVLMSEGKIACIGSYHECVEASGGKISKQVADSSVDNIAQDQSIVEGKGDTETMTLKRVINNADYDDSKEMNVKGLVKAETFINYAKAMGGVWIGVAMILLFTVTQASVILTITTLGRWAERPVDEQNSRGIIGLVVGLGCCVVIFASARSALSFWLTVRASQRLHDKMAKAVLRAKVEFFDTNPLGRILNRFSADVGSNDDLLPHTLFDFTMIAFMVLGALVTAISVLPFILIALPPLIWYFLSVRKIFVTTTRELKRLEGLARSPIFAMLGESLSGIATIRSNNYIGFFKKKFKEAHDAHSRAFFSFIASSRWIGFRMDSLMFIVLSLASFLSVLFHQQEWFNIDPAILGLSLSMLVQMAGIFQWCIRQSAEVINQMVSVERVLGFGDIAPEADLELPTDKELTGWPQDGAISVDGLSARYRKILPLALKNVSFSIPSGSRVGVVGRTGSGKSSLVQCIFRLLEAENGSIRLDGIDIANVGLHTLRTRISVIPQLPVLFSGCSVRENLDPFAAHKDEEIREALRDVHMLGAIEDLPEGFDSMVAEGGSNFSVGQRQLLCLARAILKRNKILVLDEPTANVDRRTDELLQESLQKSFKDATIISVAHRLDTIIEYDFILVLGHGHVLEFGTPAELVGKQGGYFASMVNDTGDAMASNLRRKALAASR